MMQRTAGSGSVLVNYSVSKSIVATAVQRVVGPALIYTYCKNEKNDATEAEVEEWLRRWKRGDERRALVTDDYISRGWEAPCVMVIGEYGKENLVMRTCGFCCLIKIK